MAMQYEQEWAEAQKIALSVDLVEAAKKQLQFLAAVDRNRFLLESHALQRAIYRYNAFWIPLLAKYEDNLVCEDPLVIPLDCEWIWHCHRLNPVTYKTDCEKLFGRILSNRNVISSVHATSKTTTEQIWNKLYPEEPYELDLTRPFIKDVSLIEKFTSYDLVSASKRQSSFIFQVARPHMSDDLFLRESLARYKGFLHLARINRKLKLRRVCVPFYDIDLMWHSHQLHTDAYCKDMTELVGSVVQHDDTVADRSKGQKLDLGQSETTKQWEDTFGFSYWKAGTMHKGRSSIPVTQVPYELNVGDNECNIFKKCGLQITAPSVNAVEVVLEFVDIKNLPEEHKGNLVVVFSKKNSDKLCNTTRSLRISSDCNEKQVALFRCEPKGELLFVLSTQLPSNDLKPKSVQHVGSCSLSIESMLASQSQLSIDKWVSVDLVSDFKNFEPILLRVCISFTPPTPVPQLYQLVRSQPEFQTHVSDYDGNKIFGLQTRDTIKDSTNGTPVLGKEVYSITDSGEKHTLVEFHGNYWSIKGSQGSFMLQNSSGNDDSLFELAGYKMVKFFPGRRLEFEPRNQEKQRPEQEFITAVEFSTDYPYGKAVALIDTESETIKTTNEWIVLPAIALAFILSEILKGKAEIGAYFSKYISFCASERVGKVKNVGSHGTKARINARCIDMFTCADCDDGYKEAKVEGSLCAGECVDSVKNGYEEAKVAAHCLIVSNSFCQ